MTIYMATVTLSSDGMGEASESDYDSYTAYVSERIESRVGFDVTVESLRFGDGCARGVRADSEDQQETLRLVLDDLWAEWCAQGEARP